MNPKTPGVRLYLYLFIFIIFIRCPSTSSSFWETAWSSLRCRSRWSWPWTSATRLGREWWDTFSKPPDQIRMPLDSHFMNNRSFSGWWLDLYLVQHYHCSLPCTLRHPRHRSSFDWSLNWATRYIANLALARYSQIRLKTKLQSNVPNFTKDLFQGSLGWTMFSPSLVSWQCLSLSHSGLLLRITLYVTWITLFSCSIFITKTAISRLYLYLVYRCPSLCWNDAQTDIKTKSQW